MYVQIRTTIGLGTTNPNVLAGNQFEFFPTRAIAEIAILGSATGLVADVLVGQRAVITQMPVSVVTLANRFGIYPDDFTVKAPGQAGERVIIRIQNPTGGNIDSLVSVKYNPV